MVVIRSLPQGETYVGHAVGQLDHGGVRYGTDTLIIFHARTLGTCTPFFVRQRVHNLRRHERLCLVQPQRPGAFPHVVVRQTGILDTVVEPGPEHHGQNVFHPRAYLVSITGHQFRYTVQMVRIRQVYAIKLVDGRMRLMRGMADTFQQVRLPFQYFRK